ncbi:hypothetical protein [Streptomyces griseoluteus]|uniref:hypothetical protein n=1 Tax=Streptomyces griseoluteus TaxID=29306 RepID=UPI0036FBB3D4
MNAPRRIADRHRPCFVGWRAAPPRWRRPGRLEEPWHGPTYQAVLKDKSKDDRYYEVLEFPSLEAAGRSRHDPEARAFAERMAALCTSPPSFIECDLLESSRPS